MQNKTPLNLDELMAAGPRGVCVMPSKDKKMLSSFAWRDSPDLKSLYVDMIRAIIETAIVDGLGDDVIKELFSPPSTPKG